MPDTDSTFKSTHEEARETLLGMPPEACQAAINETGMSNFGPNVAEPVDEWQHRSVESLLRTCDHNSEIRDNLSRVLGILTDDERKHKLVGEQVNLTRRATGAAEKSADSAASMLNAFYVAVVISALALAVSCIALWKD